MKTEGLSINLATVRHQFDLKTGVEALVKHGIRGASPWREDVPALSGDNRRMIDEGAAIGADCLVMIGGGMAPGSRDIAAARKRYLDGMAAILPHARACGVALAVEPLHPMYAAGRGRTSLL